MSAIMSVPPELESTLKSIVLATAIRKAPMTDERKTLSIRGASSFTVRSKPPIKSVVSALPIKVFTAIPLPSTINATRIRSRLMTVEILPAETGITKLKMTEIPLVPPSRTPCGNIKK